MGYMKSITEANIAKGTRVFVAADLDVPVEDGVIGEKYRLDCLTPTLKYIIENKKKTLIKKINLLNHLLPITAFRIGSLDRKVLSMKTKIDKENN